MSSTKFVFFGPIRKNKMAALACDWLRHFRLLLWNRWREFNETWQETRSQRPLPSLCVLSRSEKRWPPWPLIGWDIFDFSETAEGNTIKLVRKQDLNLLYQVCILRADQKNKMTALASDWLRDIFNFSSETAEQNSTKVVRKQDLNLPYQVCVLRPISKQKWPPWPIRQKGGTLYSGAPYVALWASCFSSMKTNTYILYSEWNGSKNDTGISFHKFIKKYCNINFLKIFTSPFLLWWRKTPLQYKL